MTEAGSEASLLSDSVMESEHDAGASNNKRVQGGTLSGFSDAE